jgi:methylated-DNA-[protein]-cysteine S-methyltransferase
MMKKFNKGILKSPTGMLEITATENGISEIKFLDDSESIPVYKAEERIEQCKLQLCEYFEGTRFSFDIEIDVEGTEFQKKVWNELLNIPYGKTQSYLELAIRLGDKKLIRAVGLANGKNPLPIIIPCHRIIGSDGSLIGYAGGLWRKKWLLDHEAKFSGSKKQLEIF